METVILPTATTIAMMKLFSSTGRLARAWSGRADQYRLVVGVAEQWAGRDRHLPVGDDALLVGGADEAR